MKITIDEYHAANQCLWALWNTDSELMKMIDPIFKEKTGYSLVINQEALYSDFLANMNFAMMIEEFYVWVQNLDEFTKMEKILQQGLGKDLCKCLEPFFLQQKISEFLRTTLVSKYKFLFIKNFCNFQDQI